MSSTDIGSTLPTRAVGRQSVARSVADYVKDLILDGKLRPGDRVPQDQVAAALGVSNTPVREALISLQHEGIVTIELHRGAFVNAFDIESIRAQYDLYVLVFSWAVRRAVPRLTPENIEELLKLGRDAKHADPAQMYAIVSRFTALLQELSRSRDWGRVLLVLQRIVPSDAFYERVPEAQAAFTGWMEPVAQAMQRGDVEEAVTFVERMMYQHGEALIRELERRDLVRSEPDGLTA